MSQPGPHDLTPHRELVSEDEAWECKVFIDSNIEALAEARTTADYCDDLLKIIEAEAIQLSVEPSADKRKADAHTSEQYRKGVRQVRAARRKAIIIETQIKFAQQKLELFRTMEATRRAREVAEHDSRLRWAATTGGHQDVAETRRSHRDRWQQPDDEQRQ